MTDYDQKRLQLEQRTVMFSVLIVKALGKHSRIPELRPVVDQIIRSATSVGANYAEANNASSKKDFTNKIFIAKKEIAETRYWLRVIKELIDEDIQELEEEAKQLNLILQKIISTIKNGAENGK